MYGIMSHQKPGKPVCTSFLYPEISFFVFFMFECQSRFFQTGLIQLAKCLEQKGSQMSFSARLDSFSFETTPPRHGGEGIFHIFQNSKIVETRSTLQVQLFSFTNQFLFFEND